MDSGNPLNVTGALETASSLDGGDGRENLVGALMEEEEFVPMDLWTAASVGEVESLKELLLRGEEVNQQNRGGWTPLHFAAYIGHGRALSFLADSGAELERGDGEGRSALMLAASCGNDAILRILLQRRANLEARDRHGWTALFFAVSSNHINAAKELLKAGADLNLPCCAKHKLSPVHIASSEGHQQILQELLAHGADLELADEFGNSPRDLARISKAPSRNRILQLLATHRQGGLEKKAAPPPSPLKRPQDPIAREIPNPPKATVNPQPQISASKARPRPENLGALLKSLGIEKYLHILEDQGVDLSTFLTLSDGELKEAGITLIGPRKKMLNAINRWRLREIPSAIAQDSDAARYVSELKSLRDQAQRKTESVLENMRKCENRCEEWGSLLRESLDLLKLLPDSTHPSVPLLRHKLTESLKRPPL